MVFTLKKRNIITLSILFLVGNISKADIKSLDDNVVQQYKKNIAKEILKAKAIRAVALGAGSYVLFKSIFRSPSNSQAITLDARTFDDNKIKVLNDLIVGFQNNNVLIINDANAKGWELIKKKILQLINGIKNTTNSLASSVPLILGQLYVGPITEWFLNSTNLKTVIDSSNFVTYLTQLKLEAVYLDYQSPILDLNNEIIFKDVTTRSPNSIADIPLQLGGVYFDEIIKLKVQAKAIAGEAPQSEQLTDNYTQRVEELSNKLVDAVAKIIAFVRYQEESYIQANNAIALEKSKEFTNNAVRLTNLTNEYCEAMKNILSNLKTNNSNDKKLLTTIFKFSNLFNQILVSVSRI